MSEIGITDYPQTTDPVIDGIGGGPIAPAPPVTEPGGEPAPPEPSPPEPDSGSLGDLGVIGLLLFVLAFIALAAAFNDFMNWLLRTVLAPFGGGRRTQQPSASAFTQALSSYLGKAASGVDAQVGNQFTRLGETTNALARGLLTVGDVVRTNARKTSALSARHASTVVTHDTTIQKVRVIQPTLRTNTQTVKVETHERTTVDKATSGAVRAQAQHITHVIDPEIAALQHRVHELERGHAEVWDLLKQHGEAVGLTGLVAGTAYGLERLGGSWIRCEGAQVLGKAACQAGPRKLKDLLDGLLDIAGIIALCPLVALMVDAAESGPVQDVLGVMVHGIDALVKCRGIKRYTPPAVAAANIGPTVFRYAALGPLV